MKVKIKILTIDTSSQESIKKAEEELAALLLNGWEIITSSGNAECKSLVILQKDIIEVSG